MVKDLLTITSNTKLKKDFDGDVLLLNSACLTILSKVTGNIFLSPNSKLIVKGDVDGSTIYGDRQSMIEIKTKKCHVDVVLKEAVLIVEEGCSLYGNIHNDSGFPLIKGNHFDVLD